MPVFFIHSTQVEDEKITIPDPLASHLSKSLRTRSGDHLILNDERGKRYHTIVLQITRERIHSKILSIQESAPCSTPFITLAQAILKGEKMGWVIQKATELGIRAFVPLITERVVSRVSSKHVAGWQERWERIALEAAQQSERWDVPTILPPQRFTDFLQQEDKGIMIVLAERQEKISLPLTKIPLSSKVQGEITVITGPEGGWTNAELQTALFRGASFATLGKGILRAETASLASLAILQARLNYL